MADRARCKFVVTSTEGSATHEGSGQRVVLDARYDEPLSAEDEAFSKYTPSGRLEMTINNPALEGFFEKDVAYYVDLTRA